MLDQTFCLIFVNLYYYMKFLLGKKLEMTQVWKGDKVVGITKIQAGSCIVVQVKDKKKDGYQAIQIGFGKKKEKNISKPQKGHLKGLDNFRYLREFRIDDEKIKKGDKIDISIFEPGDKVKVSGISKGKGFQGVVKRHGFHGQDKTHGNKDQLRMPGSIGATGPAHVFKGQKMPGRMGGDRVTVSNLTIEEIDKENNILLIKGAVPGARNGLLLISGEGELKKVEVRSEKSKEEVRSQKSEDNKVKTIENAEQGTENKEQGEKVEVS